MPAWKKARGLVVSEPDYISGMEKKQASFVLVDLRPAPEAAKGHIRGAVGIPASALAEAKSMFPEDASAPIILYSERGEDAEAFGTVRAWGFKNVSVIAGGLTGWKKAGGSLAKGAPAVEIVYVKKLPLGEISVEEFDATARTQPEDKLILDVRDADTAARGMIPGAVNIPLDDLGGRLKELPSDREILIHCNTGIMAGMAHNTLGKNGFKSRYLNAVVQVSPDGSYELNEK